MPGTLIIAGGALEKSWERVHARFVKAAGGASAKLVIIPTAGGSDGADYCGDTITLWEKLGVSKDNISLLPVPGVQGRKRPDVQLCDTPEVSGMLDGVTGAWFIGGDQFFVWKEFYREDNSDTLALSKLRQLYKDGGVIGGSSAGAAIMSEVMVGDGTTTTALHDPHVYGYDDYWDEENGSGDPPLRIARGLGFFHLGVTDQHFNARPRLFRLIETVCLSRPAYTKGFAVSEDTALVYDAGIGTVGVIGEAGVYIVDCAAAKRAEETARITYQGVTLHLINEGDIYDPINDNFIFVNGTQNNRLFALHRDIIPGEVPSSLDFGSYIMDHVVLNKDEALQFDPDKGLYYSRSFLVYDVNGNYRGHELRYYKTPQSRAYRNGPISVSFRNVVLGTKAYDITPCTCPKT